MNTGQISIGFLNLQIKIISKGFFRNFGYFWSDTRRSVTDPCSGNYHGEYAFSEPETRAIRVGALMKKLEEVRYKTFRMCLGKEREM